MSTAVSEIEASGDPSARLHLALACLAIALGSALLAVQVDATGSVVGTGFTALGIGSLVALIASMFQAGATRSLPRTPLQLFSTAIGFFGLASLVAGVLAPGGGWMFVEVFLLLWVLSRPRSEEQSRWPEIGRGTIFLVGVMLLFRLWITYQGARRAWEVISIPVPLVSSIESDWLAPIQSISLGSFTPHELGFPPTGLRFPPTLALWALGFVLCAAGLWLRNVATREVENDRIDALIHTLPPVLARLVERILPEDEWEELGLHGLPERRLARRIEALVTERVARERNIRRAFAESSEHLLPGPEEGFSGSITRALARYKEEGESGV